MVHQLCATSRLKQLKCLLRRTGDIILTSRMIYLLLQTAKNAIGIVTAATLYKIDERMKSDFMLS